MTSPALLIYRASRLLSSFNVQIPKHHIWILNRPFVTTQLLNRGKGSLYWLAKRNKLDNEVRFRLKTVLSALLTNSFQPDYTHFVLD